MIGNIVAGLYDAGAPLEVGDFESIATVTVGAGGASEIEFTSIPSTFQHLQVRYMLRSDLSGQDRGGGIIRFNSDTGSNYSRHVLYGTGATAASEAGTSTTIIYTGLSDIPGATATSSIFGVGVIDILDYKDTNKYTTVRVLSGQDQNSTSGRIFLSSGNWRNTSAISTITITAENANLVQYSHAALYGIKG